MNQKEINELKRRFRADRTSITHIYGCYVNNKREIISRVGTSLGMIPQEEAELYLDRLKKALGGSLGKNLVDVVFSSEQVNDSDEHRLLMALRDSRLEDAEIREELYGKIIESLDMQEQSYLILLAFDGYDVTSRGEKREDQVFNYFVCAICPVKDGGTALSYSHDENAFHISGLGPVAGLTELGFVFPAFDDRRSNISNALYYMKNPAQLHSELLSGLFNTEVPMSAAEQQEVFKSALTEGLEQECSYDAVQIIHEQVREKILQHKDEKDPEPPELTLRELGNMLENGGVSQEHIDAFRARFDDGFGHHAVLNPNNVIDSGKFEISTPEVKLSVNPEFSYMVETRVIDGRKYLLVPADQDVEVNGIPVHV